MKKLLTAAFLLLAVTVFGQKNFVSTKNTSYVWSERTKAWVQSEESDDLIKVIVTKDYVRVDNRNNSRYDIVKVEKSEKETSDSYGFFVLDCRDADNKRCSLAVFFTGDDFIKLIVIYSDIKFVYSN